MKLWFQPGFGFAIIFSRLEPEDSYIDHLVWRLDRTRKWQPPSPTDAAWVPMELEMSGKKVEPDSIFPGPQHDIIWRGTVVASQISIQLVAICNLTA